MNWDVLKLLYVHEIKMLVRARRTVVMAVVIPAIIMPIMLFSSQVCQRAAPAGAGTNHLQLRCHRTNWRIVSAN